MAAPRRMVVGARPPRHGDPARRDYHRHPVRLGAPEACRSGAMADREGDRTGAERAARLTLTTFHGGSQSGLAILGSTDKISAKGAGSGAGNADVDRDPGRDEAVGYEVEKDTD